MSEKVEVEGLGMLTVWIAALAVPVYFVAIRLGQLLAVLREILEKMP